MSPELHTVLNTPPAGAVERFDELRADLVSFLDLTHIPPTYLWLLSPPRHGVWEIRSHLDDMHIRV